MSEWIWKSFQEAKQLPHFPVRGWMSLEQQAPSPEQHRGFLVGLWLVLPGGHSCERMTGSEVQVWIVLTKLETPGAGCPRWMHFITFGSNSHHLSMNFSFVSSFWTCVLNHSIVLVIYTKAASHQLCFFRSRPGNGFNLATGFPPLSPAVPVSSVYLVSE